MAGGDCDQISVQTVLDNIPCIKLITIALLRENDGGIQRTGAAGSSMRDEMDIRKISRLAIEVRLRRGLRTGKYFAVRVGEILGDVLDFGRGLRQFWKFRVRGN